MHDMFFYVMSCNDIVKLKYPSWTLWNLSKWLDIFQGRWIISFMLKKHSKTRGIDFIVRVSYHGKRSIYDLLNYKCFE